MGLAASQKLLLKIFFNLGLRKYVNVYPTIHSARRSIILPILGGVGYTNRRPREPWLGSVFGALLSLKEGAFIDVGVNLGQTLITFLEQADGRDYYGFEPNPLCVAYVDELKRLNHCQNVTIVPVGLSDRDSLLKLYSRGEHSSDASLVREGLADEACARAQYVPVFRGDRLIETLGIQSVGVLKIDVELAELEVLTGLRETIAKSRPLIVCEILPAKRGPKAQWDARQRRSEQVAQFVAANGYRIYRLLHQGGIAPVHEIEAHSNPALRDYLFVPHELAEAVCARLATVRAADGSIAAASVAA